jgi:hypothetical protein
MENILTEKQEALLNFIGEYQMEHGGSPTLREMREHFGVSSDNSILKLLKALEVKGAISKDVKHRGIKLLSNIKAKLDSASFKLPIMGTIPAGRASEHGDKVIADVNLFLDKVPVGCLVLILSNRRLITDRESDVVVCKKKRGCVLIEHIRTSNNIVV